jgi:hypothetical protein
VYHQNGGMNSSNTVPSGSGGADLGLQSAAQAGSSLALDDTKDDSDHDDDGGSSSK